MPKRPPTSRPRTARSRTAKDEQLARFRVPADAPTLTTNQGLAVNNDQDSLKAGDRGPSLLEGFHLCEKITHFDHERIPERVVHARGSGAHGVFETYDSLADMTKASFLGEAGRQTPVFVRFSTVAGSRGSTDLARDVRGFAVKSYTHEVNFDLVGNNMPVFFIQDAIARPRQLQHRRAQTGHGTASPSDGPSTLGGRPELDTPPRPMSGRRRGLILQPLQPRTVAITPH